MDVRDSMKTMAQIASVVCLRGRAMTPAAQATHNETSRPPLIAVLVSDHRAMPRQAVHGLDDLLAASVNGR
jgi:hypothetical protein